jgi:hypothetical protein
MNFGRSAKPVRACQDADCLSGKERSIGALRRILCRFSTGTAALARSTGKKSKVEHDEKSQGPDCPNLTPKSHSGWAA